MKNVYDITPQQAPPQKKKRVAAYARVSSGKDAMLHSLKGRLIITKSTSIATRNGHLPESMLTKPRTAQRTAVNSFNCPGGLQSRENRYDCDKGNFQIRP